jgi:16S rRNA (guanine527-N7)-methyltransferase
VNLTGARTPDARVAELVAPVLPARSFLRGGHLLDIGSGNGSPGLVLAALHPFSAVTLLEPRAKRWAFLREAARELGLTAVEAQRARHDEYAGPAADTVALRGVALDPDELSPLLKPGGVLLLWRRDPPPRGWGEIGAWEAGRALMCST